MNDNKLKIANVLRWVARGVTVLLLPYLLYAVFAGYQMIRLTFYGPALIPDLVNLVCVLALIAGYVLTFWKELLGSRLVIIFATILVVMDEVSVDVAIGQFIVWQAILSDLIELLILLVPVILLYVCRRLEREG
jgi:hypothetical protein